MGSNHLSQDGVCHSSTFVPHAPEFSNQMTGRGNGFVYVDVCPVAVRQVGGMMMS